MKCSNAVLIGAQKAGTTSIYAWLSQHPEILAPDWAKDNYALFVNDELYARIEEAYAKILSERTAERLVLTSNVNYLFHPVAAERIVQFDPLMKVICILRNPVDRAFSAYQYARERDMESRSFDEAIREELQKGAESYATTWERAQKSYVDHGRYAAQIENFYRRFPPEQIFVRLYDDLRSDSDRFLRELFAFLGVDVNIRLDLSPRNVTRGGSRSKVLNRLLYSRSLRQPGVLGRLRKAIPYSVRYRFRKALIALNAKQAGQRDAMRPETRKLLLSVFAEDILRLQGLIGRDLGSWVES